MAENSRGQNRNGQGNSTNSPTRNTRDEGRSGKQDSSRGLRDTDLDRVRNNNRTPKSSGLSEKRFITGSDYDGQLSDE
jgi:hypothetical protein